MEDQKSQSRESGAKRPYETPRIIDRGDVRDVTLGGSPGVGDSGQANFDPPLPGG